MREGRDYRFHEADSLEKNLISTRYSVLDEMSNVKQSLEKQTNLLKINKFKAQQMQRKVIMLQAAERKTQKVAKNYQKKLHKLQSSQQIMANLYNLKLGEMQRRQQQISEKKKRCFSFRQNLTERKQQSVEILHRRKSMIANRMKEQEFTVKNLRQRNFQADLANRKQSTNNIREQQINARTRLQRYNQFKIAQSRYNYDLRKQQQMQKHIEKMKQLKQLNGRIGQEKEIFRKTQILDFETNQLQSFYLTSDG